MAPKKTVKPNPRPLNISEENQKVAEFYKRAEVKLKDGYNNPAANIGMMTRNSSSQGVFIQTLITKNRLQLESMYNSEVIVRRAVECFPQDATRKGIQIISEDEPSRIDELEQEWQRKGIDAKLCQNLEWGNLFGGAIAIILIKGQRFDTPLDPAKIAKGSFAGLWVVDRWRVMPSNEIVTDISDPDFALPMFYETYDEPGNPLQYQKIHHSRVLRTTGARASWYRQISELKWGLSIIEPMLDAVTNYNEALIGAGQLVNRLHLRTLSMEGYRKAMGSKQGQANINRFLNMLQMTQSSHNVSAIDSQDKMEISNGDVGTGVVEVIKQLREYVAAAVGVPVTRLFEISSGGLNSTGEGEMRQYYDEVHRFQKERMHGWYHKLIDITYMSLFSTMPPKGTKFVFKPLYEPTSKERSEVSKNTTASVMSVLDRKVIGKADALKELKATSDETGMWNTIDDEMIAAAEKQDKADLELAGKVREQQMTAPLDNPDEDEGNSGQSPQG